jgi:hypothetical protein
MTKIWNGYAIFLLAILAASLFYGHWSATLLTVAFYAFLVIWALLQKRPGLTSHEIVDDLYSNTKVWRRMEQIVSNALAELEDKKLIDGSNRPI